MDSISRRLTAIAYIIRECISGKYKAPLMTDFDSDTDTNAISSSVTVADIGCDHGYLGIYLCERDFLGDGHVLACDLRRGPLKIARTNIENAGLSDRIKTRLSDGLEKVMPGEADIITINGMGGELIFDILKAGEQVIKKAQYAVVSPQSKLAAFRHCMRRCHINISHEEVVYDSGKYYHILVLDELDKADFSDTQVFEDPGIREISFEDYAGEVSGAGIYTEELLQKRRILSEAGAKIEAGFDPEKTDSRAAERLRDIETEISYIDMVLS